MAMSFRTNVTSLDAQRNLASTVTELSRSLAKLSSGYRVTRAQDDAAGLAISVNLGAQIRSYGQAIRNASDALNITQTAESSLNETQNILTRLRELASQSASSGISNTERAGGGMRIAPDAKLNDGVLHLNLIDDVGRLEALTQLRALCRGRHIHQPYVQYLPGQWLTVDAQTPLEVAADGELLGWTPASFSIKPKAIQVLVPCKTKVRSDFIT